MCKDDNLEAVRIYCIKIILEIVTVFIKSDERK